MLKVSFLKGRCFILSSSIEMQLLYNIMLLLTLSRTVSLTWQLLYMPLSNNVQILLESVLVQYLGNIQQKGRLIHTNGSNLLRA